MLPRPHVCVLLLIAGMPGCGRFPEDTSDRHNISGMVTFEGEPIVSGMIIFHDKKTQFPTVCSIKNGYYESQKGKGPAGGEYLVTVTGYETESNAGQLGKPLWIGNWQTEIELPDDSVEKNFDIKKSEVEPADPTRSLDEEINVPNAPMKRPAGDSEAPEVPAKSAADET